MTDYLAALASAALGDGRGASALRPVRPPVFAYPVSGERPSTPVDPGPTETRDEREPSMARAPEGAESTRRLADESPPAGIGPATSRGNESATFDAAPNRGRERRAPDVDASAVPDPVVAGPSPTSAPAPVAAPRPAAAAPGPPPEDVRPAAARTSQVHVERVIEIVPARRTPAEPALPAPGSREPVAETGPRVVHVSIGRIEIRAVHPPARRAPSPPAEPAPARLSLDDYLHGREGARRR